MKHLIYIYCFHVDLLDEFIENCYPLVEKYDWVDLHIDFCKETIDELTLDKIKSKRITYGIVNNKGVDVLPFIKFLYDNVLNKEKYDVITKIHSKRSNQGQRKLMYIPMVNNFENCHNVIKNSNIPIMLNNNFILSKTNPNDNQRWEKNIINKIKILNKELNLSTEYGYFFYGTMFMTSVVFLERLFNVDFFVIENLFENNNPRFGMAHAFEKVFGYAITEFGGEHKTFECENIYVKLNPSLI
jgi:lipopolysaccharide biosynthesis protein